MPTPSSVTTQDTCWVSARGKGTTMKISLPSAVAPVVETHPGDGTQGQARQLHILAVDDEPMIRELLTTFLKSEDHTVETAVSGLEGLETFRAGRFDLVITDRAMPGMNGDQLTAAIKLLDSQIPIIMLTGFGSNMLAANEKPADVDLIVGKPFNLPDLEQALQYLFSPGDLMILGPQVAVQS